MNYRYVNSYNQSNFILITQFNLPNTVTFMTIYNIIENLKIKAFKKKKVIKV